MAALTDRHLKLSRKLIERMERSAARFGVSCRQYAGLLIKQVAIATTQSGVRINPPHSWKSYRNHSVVSYHVSVELETWDLVSQYAKEYLLHAPEVARQFLLSALDYLAKHPKAVPEDIAQGLFTQKVA